MTPRTIEVEIKGNADAFRTTLEELSELFAGMVEKIDEYLTKHAKDEGASL